MAAALSIKLSVLGLTVEPIDGLCTECWNPALVRITVVYSLNDRSVGTRVRERCRDCRG